MSPFTYTLFPNIMSKPPEAGIEVESREKSARKQNNRECLPVTLTKEWLVLAPRDRIDKR